MKIRKITFENNAVVGNLSLDFTHEGRTVNTIILAGENGAGKSYVLNALYDFATNVVNRYATAERRIFEIELHNDELAIVQGENAECFLRGKEVKDNILRITVSILPHGVHLPTYLVGFENFAGDPIELRLNPYNRRSLVIFKTLFSDVDIHFRSERLSTVTSSTIDNTATTSERSVLGLAQQINQLLVDVDAMDAQQLSAWAREHIGKPVDATQISPLMRRFTDAFSYMFPSKRYKGIETIEGAKEIVFTEHGRKMHIAELSSGEKQVVYRGSFLLRNKGSSANAVLLLDEPEISLHPKWQMNILNYYKYLFTNEQGRLTNQLIVSTHSPFVIHNARRLEDKVVILKKDTNGVVTTTAQPHFTGWTPELAVEEAFDVQPLEATAVPIAFVEGQTDQQYLQETMRLFLGAPNTLEIEWIGRLVSKGKSEFTGDSALDQARLFFLANPKMLHRRVILLYDNDTNKAVETLGDLYVRTMPAAAAGVRLTKGIESLLVIPAGFDLSPFYNVVDKVGAYGEPSRIATFDKQRFCDYVCGLPEDERRQWLANLHGLVNGLIALYRHDGQKSLI